MPVVAPVQESFDGALLDYGVLSLFSYFYNPNIAPTPKGYDIRKTMKIDRKLAEKPTGMEVFDDDYDPGKLVCTGGTKGMEWERSGARESRCTFFGLSAVLGSAKFARMDMV